MRRTLTAFGLMLVAVGPLMLTFSGCGDSDGGGGLPVSSAEAWSACGEALADLDSSLQTGAAAYTERPGEPFTLAGITDSGIGCTAITDRGGFIWVWLPDDGEPVPLNRSGSVVTFD